MADIASTVGWIAGGVGVIAAFITALSSYRKTGSEKTGILVDAAADVVVIQKNAITDLTERLEKAEKTIDAMRFMQTELESLRLEVARLQHELERVHGENESLKRQLTAARKRIKILEDGQ